jgi:hypothetical protein
MRVGYRVQVKNIQIRAGLLMDHLTLLGWFAVPQCLCYALEDRSRLFILGFVGVCALGSTCGFLLGAWPIGLIEGIWALLAFRRWAQHGRTRSLHPHTH